MESAKRLVLIGTVHGDPEGAYRLRVLLEAQKPSAVAVELSPFGLQYRKKRGRAMRALLSKRIRHLEKFTGKKLKESPIFKAIEEQIKIPFEYRASLRYCAATGASLHLIDSSELSRALIETGWDDLISLENIKKLIEIEDLHPLTASRYALARRLFEESNQAIIDPFISATACDPAFARREALLANSLEFLFRNISKGTLAFVGGWEHLLHPTSFNTLCDRIAHMNPMRILLRAKWR